eukprot:NODE_2524_length_2196_cov_8.979217.p1 GENE.NODE_2524_length_2196_cov_8.979217~~NODE_2524_length_2196_cov_8.979217.p1  ORF type:complete len:345 (+),score=53.94 NODE_2524_length_2196_cov_8.979217:1039-2073(+)
MELRKEIGLCQDNGHYEDANLINLGALALAAAIRFLQMSATFGTKVPAGLFVPSLYVGACLGRIAGLLVRSYNQEYHFLDGAVEPGVYAMVGAAAILGGVCRVTISLVVIMLELTDSLAYVVPFMISVLLAKLVGDSLYPAIYDAYIDLNVYPFLHDEVEFRPSDRCVNVMEDRITAIDLGSRPSVSDLRELLRRSEYRGFPVVRHTHFLGYLRRDSLVSLLTRLELEHESGPEAAVGPDDVLPETDCTVIRMVPHTHCSQAHMIFRQLGVHRIFLVGPLHPGDFCDEDVLRGILSKKAFIRLLDARRVGHGQSRPGDATPSAAPQAPGGQHRQPLRQNVLLQG